jgi:hypothetical protein
VVEPPVGEPVTADLVVDGRRSDGLDEIRGEPDVLRRYPVDGSFTAPLSTGMLRMRASASVQSQVSDDCPGRRNGELLEQIEQSVPVSTSLADELAGRNVRMATPTQLTIERDDDGSAHIEHSVRRRLNYESDNDGPVRRGDSRIFEPSNATASETGDKRGFDPASVGAQARFGTA